MRNVKVSYSLSCLYAYVHCLTRALAREACVSQHTSAPFTYTHSPSYTHIYMHTQLLTVLCFSTLRGRNICPAYTHRHIYLLHTNCDRYSFPQVYTQYIQFKLCCSLSPATTVYSYEYLYVYFYISISRSKSVAFCLQQLFH